MSRQQGNAHWHITRDRKPKGQCAGCDPYWKEVEDGTYDGADTPPRMPRQGE
jgi:hypothetical protein